jgi:hypothetical protein
MVARAAIRSLPVAFHFCCARRRKWGRLTLGLVARAAIRSLAVAVPVLLRAQGNG